MANANDFFNTTTNITAATLMPNVTWARDGMVIQSDTTVAMLRARIKDLEAELDEIKHGNQRKLDADRRND